MQHLQVSCGGARNLVDVVLDPLVPLLLGLAVEQSNNAHRHVVASNTAGIRIRCQAAVHEVFADILELFTVGDGASHDVDHVLTAEAIPDTVAGENEELVLSFCDILLEHLGEGGNDLLLDREVKCPLELKVTNGTTESQVSVDTSPADVTAGILDTATFRIERWLVIVAHILDETASRQNTTRVTCVCTVDSLDPLWVVGLCLNEGGNGCTAEGSLV